MEGQKGYAPSCNPYRSLCGYRGGLLAHRACKLRLLRTLRHAPGLRVSCVFLWSFDGLSRFLVLQKFWVKGQGAGWALRAACYIPSFILDDSGPGVKREQGGGVQSITGTPRGRLGFVGFVCLQNLGSGTFFFFNPVRMFRRVLFLSLVLPCILEYIQLLTANYTISEKNYC